MDFTFTPEQDEAAELAARILKDRATNERMKQVEAGGDRFDPELWAELGSAGLLGLALPEEYDGAGLGLIELCRVLVEVGRTVAPVPLVAHGAAGRLIAEQGTADQKQAWLPGAASGARLLTAAVAEDRESLPQHPADDGRTRTDDGWTLNGVKTLVPTGTRADLFLVTATTPSGSGVFLVEPGADGVTVLPQRTSDGDLAARVELHDVHRGDDAVLGDGRRCRRAAARPAPGPGRLRGAARGHRGRARADLGVREGARAVRPADRHLPGRLATAGRRLHRRPRPGAHPVAGGVAARGGPSGGHRAGRREAVGGRRRPPARAHDRPRPRRGRHRPGRGGPPLLHDRQALRVRLRRDDRAGARTSAGRSPPSLASPACLTRDVDDAPAAPPRPGRRRPSRPRHPGPELDLGRARRRGHGAGDGAAHAAGRGPATPRRGAARQHRRDGDGPVGSRARWSRGSRAQHDPAG